MIAPAACVYAAGSAGGGCHFAEGDTGLVDNLLRAYSAQVCWLCWLAVLVVLVDCKSSCMQQLLTLQGMHCTVHVPTHVCSCTSSLQLLAEAAWCCFVCTYNSARGGLEGWAAHPAPCTAVV